MTRGVYTEHRKFRVISRDYKKQKLVSDVARKIFLNGMLKQLRNELRFLEGEEKEECEEEIRIISEELRYL